MASCLESHGTASEIEIGEAAHCRLRDRYAFEPRGQIEIKGKGRHAAYLLKGRLGPR